MPVVFRTPPSLSCFRQRHRVGRRFIVRTKKCPEPVTRFRAFVHLRQGFRAEVDQAKGSHVCQPAVFRSDGADFSFHLAKSMHPPTRRLQSPLSVRRLRIGDNLNLAVAAERGRTRAPHTLRPGTHIYLEIQNGLAANSPPQRRRSEASARQSGAVRLRGQQFIPPFRARGAKAARPLAVRRKTLCLASTVERFRVRSNVSAKGGTKQKCPEPDRFRACRRG